MALVQPLMALPPNSLQALVKGTAKDEIDKHTYSLFDLEAGVPRDIYELDEAVRDGYLLPPS